MSVSANAKLVQSLIDHFEKKGLKVKFANLSGYDSPQVIKRHSPDVLAMDSTDGLGYIGLAKSCEELEESLTLEQFEDFSKRLMKNGKSEKARVPFVIAVPAECKDKVKETFEKHSLSWRDNVSVIAV